VSFDDMCSAAEMRTFMDAKDFDVVGVRLDGLVVGYVHREDLSSGTLGDHITPFVDSDLLDETAPMTEVLQRLSHSPRIFVQVMGHVSGIITKGDLQKAPIRMWLFGLLTLLELQLLRLIRMTYPDDTWTHTIPEGRLRKASELLKDRRRRNEAISLADCLQLADMMTVVLKTDYLRTVLELESRQQGEQLFDELKNLRNDLAHSQDIISPRWPELAELVSQTEHLLARCEQLGGLHG
jgi:hypothetical protein